ncbi:MAG TPA: YggS family pyridoxal phosphate enzyme [Solirubrobacteraceae bacterium]|nr:YggS family pyridoxal phosphate enzyme [Solirubrobacteraceae bacterium]
MAEPIVGLDAERVAANLAAVRAEIAEAAGRAGRDPDAVEVCVATKYVVPEEMPILVEAGVTLAGENRQQDLSTKRAVLEDHGVAHRLTFDFIGHLQSRKVKQVLPLVRLIHSVASESALRELEKHGTPETEVLVEVNVSGEPGKSGLDPASLDAFLERSPVAVRGLMTMPPLAEDPEESRPHFARLAALARERGLETLSMGTTQDFAVAVQEGATIVRVGTILFR